MAHFGNHVFPELEGFQHIGFVHASDAAFAACCLAGARGLEGDMGNTLNFRLAIAHGVEGFFGAGEVAVGGGAPSARLAKINVAREFADDQDIEARDQFGLEAGGIDQLLVANSGAEIGEQAQVLAQAQNGLLGAQGAL